MPPETGPTSTPPATDPPSMPVDAAVDGAAKDSAAGDSVAEVSAAGDSAAGVSAPTRHYVLPSGHFGFLFYNLLRIGLLLVVGGILYLVGFRSYLLVLVAVFISGMMSMVLLNRRRDAAVISLGKVYRRVSDRMDSRTRAEDE